MTLRFDSSLATVSRETGGELGGAVLGAPPGGTMPPWPIQRIFAPILGSTVSFVQEVWRTDQPIVSGRSEDIVWRRTDGLLYGVITLDEADFPNTPECSSLQAASREAYRRIFHLLDAQRLPHLWRVWNYMAAINRETQGLERYRQFNIGRQDAFVDEHRGTSGNVPAACAIGLAGGLLNIAFMAGASPTVPVENPRQVSAYDYPADYGPRSPVFSRAALACLPDQELLFVSGTASIVGHLTVHPGDVTAQRREAMANVAAVRCEANLQCRSAPFGLNELSYRAYIRHARDLDAVRNTLKPLIGTAEIVYVQADICRQDLLLEIEAVASHALGG